MTNQSTIDKLIEMRLTTMADAFRNQLMILNLKKYHSRIALVCWWTLNTAIVKQSSETTDT